jgi:hypothetical protein
MANGKNARYCFSLSFHRLERRRGACDMAAGLSDHVWSLEEIVMMADSYLPKHGKRGPYKKSA